MRKALSCISATCCPVLPTSCAGRHAHFLPSFCPPVNMKRHLYGRWPLLPASTSASHLFCLYKYYIFLLSFWVKEGRHSGTSHLYLVYETSGRSCSGNKQTDLYISNIMLADDSTMPLPVHSRKATTTLTSSFLLTSTTAHASSMDAGSW